MLSKRFGISLLLAMSPALAQISSGPAATQATITPRQHAPRRAYGLTPERVIDNVTVSDSTNWSGYAVTGSSFTQAKASWTVPTVNCSTTPNTYSSFWVGLDGMDLQHGRANRHGFGLQRQNSLLLCLV